MSRSQLFDREPVAGIAGLAGLTGPAWGDKVSGVVDVVVFGAKSDGKTQFITHAIRTVEAFAPAGLSAEERLQNEKILSLVVNAKRPTPEANPDRRVRHYVFRMKPEKIYQGLGIVDRARALWRSGALAGYAALATLSAVAVGAAIFLLRRGLDEAVLGGAVASLLGGLWLAGRAARTAFLGEGELEVCFWDVAGEDVYSDRGAGGYHSFLEMLVRARRVHNPAGRRYALAPILICNPLSVGTRAEDSPYARLRMIMPTFAALGRPQPDVLVVVNRWRLVRAICGPGAGEADDCVVVLPIARDIDNSAAAAAPDAARDPIPVIRRSVVIKHCRDGDPPEIGSTRFETVHYEAGLDPSCEELEWPGWDKLPEDVRGRWSEAKDKELKAFYRYTYSEGPGSLVGETALSFFGWMARLLWNGAPPSEEEQAEPQPQPKPAELPGGTVKMYAVSEQSGERAARSPSAAENPGGFRSGGR